MAKKDRGAKGKQKDRKQESPPSDDTATATIAGVVERETAVRASEQSAPQAAPDATATLDARRPDRTVVDARLDQDRDFDHLKVDKQLADHDADTTALPDALGKGSLRHQGPGIDEMFGRADKLGIGKQGVDQYLFHRENEDNAPPTHKVGGNDPAWSSQGWRDTGNKMARDALEKPSSTDAGVTPTAKGDTSNPGTLSGGSSEGTLEELQARERRAVLQESMNKAGVEQAGRKAQEIEDKKAADKAAADKKAADDKAAADKKAADEKKAAEDKAKQEKEAEEARKKEQDKKKHTDPDQDTGGTSVLPDALKEEPRLLRDPEGAGVSHVVHDGTEPPTIDPTVIEQHKPGMDTGTPDKDPDYQEVALTPSAPATRYTDAPIDYGNPNDPNAPPPPGPGTGKGPGGGEADHLAAAQPGEATTGPVGTGGFAAHDMTAVVDQTGAAPPSGDGGTASIDTGPPPAVAHDGAGPAEVAVGNDFAAPTPDAPSHDPGAVLGDGSDDDGI